MSVLCSIYIITINIGFVATIRIVSHSYIDYYIITFSSGIMWQLKYSTAFCNVMDIYNCQN